MRALWISLVACVCSASPGRALPVATDARSVARGGLDALVGLERSPATPRAPGWSVRLDALDLYAGTGITAAAACVEIGTSRAAFGVAFGELRSPVGGTTSVTTVVQLRHGTWRGGCSAEARSVRFDGEIPEWEIVPRVGLGCALPAKVMLAGVAEFVPGPGAHPRLALAVEVPVSSGIQLGAQLGREPGLESDLRLGLDFEAGPLSALAGFEAATQSVCVGLGWSWGGQEIVWGARTHPALGWSQAWTYELSR